MLARRILSFVLLVTFCGVTSSASAQTSSTPEATAQPSPTATKASGPRKSPTAVIKHTPVPKSTAVTGPTVVVKPTAVKKPTAARKPTPVKKPKPVKKPTPVRKPTPVKRPTPRKPPKRPTTVQYVPHGWPTRLVISKIGVNAPMEYVQIEKNEHAPYKWGDVAWNYFGPRPGEAGHATIFGHLDSYCCPAVFYHLRYLGRGDVVQVNYGPKASVHFRVMWQHDYVNSQIPGKWMFAQDGQRGLILATCAGDFHRDGTGYDHKLVVFARLILPNGKLG